MLSVENLSVAYGHHRALEDVTVEIAPGEICVILGANGAGKSTLLKAIAGMVSPAPGARITIDGRDITARKPHAIVEAGIALVPEGRGIFPDLSVAENLQLGAYGRQARAHESRQHAQVLTLFPKLGERRGQTARTMSGGEQQMVAIGRALMSNPSILMLDEPSLGLSPLLTRELFRSLRAIRDTGVGILLVEQNARQSLAIADRGYLLENGHITGHDRADKLARDPAVQAAYLGGAAATVQPLAHTTRVEANVVEAGGEPTAPAMPAASPPPASMAEALARRAAAIQRGHVEKMRTGVAPAPSQMNGRAYGVIHKHIVPGEKIVMSQQAEELSRHAGEFANRARQIQAAHLAETRRKTAIWTVLSTPAFTGPDETVAETAVEGKKAKKVKKAEKKARAAARKLHKAEEKVIKLAGQLAGKLAD